MAQVELAEPRKALGQAGANTSIVSPKNERVRGWNFTDWGDEFPVDVNLDQALPQGFDALLLPAASSSRCAPHAAGGGRVREGILRCGQAGGLDLPRPLDRHRAGAARGRRMTSWLSLTDLRNAGADWVNQEVVVDQGLVTSSAGLYPTAPPGTAIRTA
jgi:protease I